jgi:hypothetical protein
VTKDVKRERERIYNVVAYQTALLVTKDGVDFQNMKEAAKR